MKFIQKNAVSIIILVLLSSCNTPPKEYTKGIESMREGEFEIAIDHFNDLNEDEVDEEWLDSAEDRKYEAFQLLIESNDWKKTLRTIEKYEDDVKFFDFGFENSEKHLKELCASGKADTVLSIVDKFRGDFNELFDSSFTTGIITLAEDNIFTESWICNQKGYEIYFEREGPMLNALSSNSKNGWTTKGIIYKNLNYIGNHQWKINPKLFQPETYYDYGYSYYSKKGTLTLLAIDTILIDYVEIGKTFLFSRKE